MEHTNTDPHTDHTHTQMQRRTCESGTIPVGNVPQRATKRAAGNKESYTSTLQRYSNKMSIIKKAVPRDGEEGGFLLCARYKGWAGALVTGPVLTKQHIYLTAAAVVC